MTARISLLAIACAIPAVAALPRWSERKRSATSRDLLDSQRAAVRACGLAADQLADLPGQSIDAPTGSAMASAGSHRHVHGDRHDEVRQFTLGPFLTQAGELTLQLLEARLLHVELPRVTLQQLPFAGSRRR